MGPTWYRCKTYRPRYLCLMLNKVGYTLVELQGHGERNPAATPAVEVGTQVAAEHNPAAVVAVHSPVEGAEHTQAAVRMLVAEGDTQVAEEHNPVVALVEHTVPTGVQHKAEQTVSVAFELPGSVS